MSVIVRGYETLVAGVACDNLSRYFDTLTVDQLASYARNNFDMASLLPMEFEIPGYDIIKKGLTSEIRKMGPRLYEAIRINLSRTHPAHSRFLAKDDLAPGASISPRQWYFQNMDRVKQRIIDQLEGRVGNDSRRTCGSENGSGDPDRGWADGDRVLPY